VPQTVTVTAVDDGVTEDTIALPLAHAIAAGSGDTAYASGSTTWLPAQTLTVFVFDNDDNTVGLGTSALYTNEGVTASYSVVLHGQPAASVSVSAVSSTPALLGVVTAMPLVFTPSNWATAQTVYVLPTEDSIDRGNSYSESLSHSAVSSDALFNGTRVKFSPVSVLPVTIYDNDNGCYR
jgi:hypothetical protein